MTIKQVLEQRHSIRTYAEDKAVSEETVMDILWAANGVTREDGRRTAPSAINAQDIDLYVCTAEGVS
ncbi:MAG: nitroreductase family protein, partial [Prevotella sp.]|nr:nitroreductase family protein [Prevotella sp.]